MKFEKLITVKKVALNNNCPECYAPNLEITFKQKFVENPFYKKITKHIVHEIHCLTCNTPVYPISWTDNIERVFEYQKRAFIPKPTNLKLKPLTWGILFGAIGILIGLTITLFVL